MARLCLTPACLAAGEVELRGADAHYLADVLRLRPGDRVTLFDGRGREADAEIVAAARGRVRVRVAPPREAPAPTGPYVALLCGLLKGAKMDWVVQKATELGVARIQPLVCSRSVPEREGAALRLGRWAKIAREASRQCGRADVPAIEAPAPFALAIGAAPPGTRRLLVHTEAAAPLARRVAGVAELVLAVGPEGGFAPAEVESAIGAGFEPVGLGRRTLRAETAAIVACAAATILAP